jgi:hypothetical protein
MDVIGNARSPLRPAKQQRIVKLEPQNYIDFLDKLQELVVAGHSRYCRRGVSVASVACFSTVSGSNASHGYRDITYGLYSNKGWSFSGGETQTATITLAVFHHIGKRWQHQTFPMIARLKMLRQPGWDQWMPTTTRYFICQTVSVSSSTAVEHQWFQSDPADQAGQWPVDGQGHRCG